MRENMYSLVRVKIARFLKRGLQDSRFFFPHIILNAFFCKRKTYLTNYPKK